MIKIMMLTLAATALVSCKSRPERSATKDINYSYGASSATDANLNVRMFKLNDNVCWVRCNYKLENDAFQPQLDGTCEARKTGFSTGPQSFAAIVDQVGKTLEDPSYALDLNTRDAVKQALMTSVVDPSVKVVDLGPSLLQGAKHPLLSFEAVSLAIYHTIDAAFETIPATADASDCLAAANSGRAAAAGPVSVNQPPPSTTANVPSARQTNYALFSSLAALSRPAVGNSQYPVPVLASAAGERYYAVIFAYEKPNLTLDVSGKITSYGSPTPLNAHTFGTFFSSTAAVTISWMPARMHQVGTPLYTTDMELAAAKPEPGSPFTLADTLSIAASNPAQKIMRWGPYEISREFFDRAVITANHLNSLATAAGPSQLTYSIHGFLTVGNWYKAFIDHMAAVESLGAAAGPNTADASIYSRAFETYLSHINQYFVVQPDSIASMNCVAALAMVEGFMAIDNLRGWYSAHELLRFYQQDPVTFAGTQFSYGQTDENAFAQLQTLEPSLQNATITEASKDAQSLFPRL